MLIGVAAAVVACLCYGVSSVLQAYGARRSAAAADLRRETGRLTAAGGPTLRSTIAAALSAAFVIGLVLDGVGFAGSAVSARLIPLFLSQTIISANLVVTAVLGAAVLGVTLRARDWAAIGTVIVSLLVLGLASGERGTVSPDRGLHWGVLAGSVFILVCGIALTRWLGSRAAVFAGLIAGVLFGAVAIAVRVLDGLEPLRPLTLVADPAAWAILVAGAGGFYLHTVALQLGSVNGATAALVVGETVMPGVIGVVLLGDTAQHDLEWLVAAGFLSAVIGAVAVAVFGADEIPTTPTSADRS
jgi:drug/metabolite transporter (DMT)-like permease